MNTAGWYISTNRELEGATLASVTSEDIHNIEHYRTSHPTAGPATLLYGSCKSVSDGTPLFFRASNMPHTEEIFEKKFTAFAAKPSESMVATHGYGAVLPPMYIGGYYEGEFLDERTGAWMQFEFNIEEQYEECVRDNDLRTFPSKPKKLRGHTSRCIENAALWPAEVLRAFQTHRICTLEVHTSPTFMGHEDIRNPEHFSQFLECVQAQFEEMLVRKEVVIAGLFVDDEGQTTTYTLPHNFYATHYPGSTGFPLSPYGITQLDDALDFDITYTDTSMHGCVTLPNGPVYFSIGPTGAARGVEAIPGFTPRITVRIGRITKDIELYARKMTETVKHPLHLDLLQSFADGLLVNLGESYRMTMKPLHGVLPRSQYLPYLAKTRVRAIVHDRETKRLYIDAKAHKDTSTLKMIRDGRGNPIQLAVTALCTLVKSAVETGTLDTTRLLDQLTRAPARRVARVRNAVNNGLSYEAICVEALQGSLSHTVIGNDIVIRRDILGTTDSQYQGIDAFIQTNAGVSIAIQCKRKERVSGPDVESFLRTLKYARERFESDYVHGLFVVQKDPDMNANLRELLATPSVQLLVVPETQVGELVTRVTAILKFYGR